MLSNPRTDSLNCASEALEIALKLDCEAKFSIYESELFKLNVNMHSLCTWKDVINYIESEKIYSEDKVSNLKEFLEDPEKWRSKYA